MDIKNNQQEGQVVDIILTKEQRIRILDNVIKELNAKKQSLILEVSLNAGPITNIKDNSEDCFLEYQIPGYKYRHRSRHSNLLEKLEELEKITKMKQQQELEGDQGNEPKQSESDDNTPEEDPLAIAKAEANFRYYKDNILCFKCGKAGHYRTVCPNPKTCMYCFSESHQSQSCPQKKVCFRCFNFGHIIAHCNSKQSGTKCQSCEKYHGEGCNFLMNRNRDPGKKRQFYDTIYNDKQIRCAKCLQYGHLECIDF